MLVHHFLEESAEKFPYKDAAVHLGGRINYLELETACNRLANYFLSAGIKPGDRIGILLESSINYIIAYFAILKAGGVVVGLNTQSAQRNYKNILGDCEVTALIVGKKNAHVVKGIYKDLPSLKLIVCDGTYDRIPKELETEFWLNIQLNGDPSRLTVSRTLENYAQIIYTSGTTGSPKGVTLSHGNLLANTESIVKYLDLQPDDRVMAILPFYYSYGNSLLLTHIYCGGCLVIDNRFAYPNVILDIMAQERVTGFSGVPSTFAILMHKSNILNYRFDHLRYITQAGGPMTPALTQKILEALPHIKIFIMYGQTEASARLSYLKPARLLEKIGSIGTAIPGVQLTVKDDKGRVCKPGEVGEIVARGENIMIGYWNQPEATKTVLHKDGLHTGDLARIDEDGYLYIVSRKSDMIKSGAHRISPKEIEEVFAEFPGLIESAVIGVPDEILGEAIIAYIVTQDGFDQKELRKHLRLNLASFKLPKDIIPVKSLPKTSSGKIKKFQMIEDYTQKEGK
ncbi:MAG: acyl--CoA ligase [candidate division Zixibacteria bacterium]|nr:acyl--CoA ligase [candidate division Zixibacteria bacterium]